MWYQNRERKRADRIHWIPACAGMTNLAPGAMPTLASACVLAVSIRQNQKRVRD